MLRDVETKALKASHTRSAVIERPYIQHRGRRDYNLSYKIDVVEETMAPGASVSVVARRHNINTNVIFRWRSQYRRGELRVPPCAEARGLDGFITVGTIGADGSLTREIGTELRAPSVASPPVSARPCNDEEPDRRVEIELHGGIRLRFEAGTDMEYLRRVILMTRALS